MKKFSANFVFPANSAPIANGVLITNDHGEVLDVLPNADGLEDVLHNEGFLCPGFVNAHCHLELSHLKGKLASGQGLVDFLAPIINMREAKKDVIESSMMEAENSMRNNGIVAIGDICNTSDSFDLKSKSSMKYHNYIEVISLDPSRAGMVYANGLELYNKSMELDIPSSIVPHAPYTASPDLLNLLADHSRESGGQLCIHNQESEHENLLFMKGTGPIKEFYADHRDMDLDFFNITETSSMEAVLNAIGEDVRILMVHNTYTQASDIAMADTYGSLVSYCLCPNANMFIEGVLPDLSLFVGGKHEVMLGTDSLASNWSLSILDEMKTIMGGDTEVDLQTLVKWATFNGAKYLGLDDILGSFEKGKTPGVNLIYDVDTENLSINKESKIKVLL